MKLWSLLGLATVLLNMTSGDMAPQSEDRMLVDAGHAQLLINTMFSEHSPGFNDIYMIQTPDKGREILIYCNPSYCYKLKGHTVPV